MSQGAGRGSGTGGLGRPGRCLQSTGQWPKPAGVSRTKGGRTREPGASSVVPVPPTFWAGPRPGARSGHSLGDEHSHRQKQDPAFPEPWSTLEPNPLIFLFL